MTGEMCVGDTKLPEIVTSIFEHSSQFAPMFMALNANAVYKNNINTGKETEESVKNAVLSNLTHITEGLPIIQRTYNPVEAIGRIVKSSFGKIGQWDDVDQEGNPIKRKAFEFKDYFGDKKEVLSDAYYKMALKIKRGYEAQITQVMNDGNLSETEKSRQRKELLQQEQADIDDIYRQNKENPQ